MRHTCELVTWTVALIAWVAAAGLLVMPSPAVAQMEPEIERRGGEFIRRSVDNDSGAVDQLPNGPITVRYLDADVSAVIDDIIGEALQLDYTIAADVQGRVSFRMTDVQTRDAVLEQLRSALAALNIAMVDRGDFIAFVRGGGRGQSGNVEIVRAGQPVAPGVGVAAIVFREVAPSAISTLLAALSPGVEVRLTDDVRRLAVLVGESEALSAASEASLLLDVDAVGQISTGVFPIRHADAGIVAQELRSLMQAAPDAIEIIPIERLGVVIILANSARDLDRASIWLRRLDRPSAASDNRTRVYRVRHSDPRELVEAIRELAGTASVAGRPQSELTSGGGGLLEGVIVGAAPNRDVVLLQGEPARLERVIEALELIDQPLPQVAIEAAIVEITLTEETRFGVDWSGVEDKRLTVGWVGRSDGEIGRQTPGFSAVYVNTDLGAALNALASQSELNVISRPSLLALHNEEAELQVGDQVPVVVQSAVSVTDPEAPIVNQTAYRNTGVLLTVRPQVRAAGFIELEVSQEVSGVVQTTSSGIDSPTITQRRISSTLLVPSGETVALGGLISTRHVVSENGVPILRRAPLIGRAFRSDTSSEDRTELVILITPTVIIDPTEADDALIEISDAIARLRARFDAPGPKSRAQRN